MSRPGERTPKLISLEIARFLAAFCVATDHITAFITGIGTGVPLHGFSLPPITGVLFFLVLSGFVISNAHAADQGRPSRLPRYVWRRLCRIFPLYWLSLVAMLWFMWPRCSTAYLAQILTLWPFTDNITEMNPPAWTLRFELTFYMLYGLALLPYLRRVFIPLWIFFLVWEWFPALLPLHGSLLLHIAIPAGINWHVLGIHNVMFFAGLGAARLYRRWQPPAWSLWPLLVAGLTGVVYFSAHSDWGFLYPSVNAEPFAAACFAAIVFALAALERGGLLRPGPGWAALGAMSYPLYLFHPDITFLTGTFTLYHPGSQHWLAPSLLFALMMSAALLVTAAATFLFDRPLQRLARRVF